MPEVKNMSLKERKGNDALSSESRQDHLFVGSLEKGFKVLEAFTASQPELGLAEIVRITGFNKSAAQRFAHTLHQLGYLRKDARSKRYSVSHAIMGPAFTFLRSNRLVEAATPHVAALRHQFGNRVGFVFHDDTDLMYLIALKSNRTVYATAHPGYRIPVYCTSSGRSILAFLPENQARDILNRSNLVRRTEMTIVDPDKIMEEVQIVRSQGFAITKNELNPGEINLSAPVFDSAGIPIGAIATASRIDDWKRDRLLSELAPSIVDAARSLSQHAHLATLATNFEP